MMIISETIIYQQLQYVVLFSRHDHPFKKSCTWSKDTFLIAVINYIPALHGLQTLEDLTLSNPLYHHLPDVQESKRDKTPVMPQSFMDLWSEHTQQGAFHLYRQYLNRCALMPLYPGKGIDNKQRKIIEWEEQESQNVRQQSAHQLL